jgi:hypothetical protein
MTNYQKFLNATQAAEYLGISRKHFYRVKAKYGIKPMGKEAHMPLYSLMQLSGALRKLKKLRALYGGKKPVTEAGES